jgi:hypothetical protein
LKISLIFNEFPFKGLGVKNLKINELGLFGADSTLVAKRLDKYTNLVHLIFIAYYLMAGKQGLEEGDLSRVLVTKVEHKGKMRLNYNLAWL